MKPLAPIRITDRTRRVRPDGSLAGSEIWAAETTDGAWSIVREEVPGTPWTVVRKADKRRGGSYRNLDVARHAIAIGWAAKQADEQVAA